MKLTVDDVRHVAKLAALSLSPDEEQRFVGQLQQVLDGFEALAAIDTAGVPATVLAEGVPLRPDVAQAGLGVEVALANAPARDGSSFAVPKVIE